MIGALFGGAYFTDPASANLVEASDGAFVSLADGASLATAFAIALVVLVVYRWLFPDPQLAARKHAASAILLGLTAIGIQLWFGHVLLRGTLEPSDRANLLQLNGLVIQFSQVLLAISALAFGILALFALFKRPAQ